MKINLQALALYRMIFYFILILLSSCATSPEGDNDTKTRWKFIESFGETPITTLYVNEAGDQLSITSENYFGIIPSGSVEPTLINDLQTPSHDCYRYVPFITDQYYFYCNANGDLLHIGNNTTGEHLGTINIEDIVDGADLPAQFTRSLDRYHSNHMEYHDGLYMISIRHLAISQDDWLYFGDFTFSGDEISFNIAKKVITYEVPAPSSVWVRSNYYYGGYFWQYRNENFNSNVCAVNENDFSVIYTTFIPAITDVYQYYDYLLGFFDGPVKKSFDGGFTWEDWITLNAPWNHVVIQGVNVLFFSHNLGSVDFELLETEDYDNGELKSHCITNLIEFDGRVFAGTVDGLYYCDLDDFFVPKPELHRRESDLEVHLIISE